MQELMLDCGCTISTLDQCMYGLRIRDGQSKLGLALKATVFAGTLPGLARLSRRCSHQHEHVAVVGGVKFNGKWCKRSSLAGAYPKQLCTANARIVEELFD